MGNEIAGNMRANEVESLWGSFEEILGGRGPKMHVLEAPTGWGKTFIVQKFYERLASAQQDPPYWPPSLTSDSSESTWQHSRKRIIPESFSIPPGAMPEWLWWGVSCSRRQDGRFAQSLFEDNVQLAVHAGALYERLSNLDKAGRTFDGANALIGLLAAVTLPIAAPLGVALGVTGAVRTAWQNRDLLEKVRRRRNANRETLRDIAPGPQHSAVAELAKSLRGIARELPVILVVDDAQWADVTLVQLLSDAMQSTDAQILIVATAWPESDTTSPFFEWMRDHRGNEDVRVSALEPLASPDLHQMIRFEYRKLAGKDAPELDEATVSAMATRVGATPLGVRAAFGVRQLRDLVEAGSIIRTTDVARLPGELGHILLDYWKQLPGPVRFALASAAVAGRRYPPAPVLAAAMSQGFEDARTDLLRGGSTNDFIRALEAQVAEFIDPIWWETARSAAEEDLPNAFLKELHQSIVDFVLAVDPHDDSPLLCTTAWSSHVALAQDGLAETSGAAQSAFNLAEVVSYQGDRPQALGLFELAAKWSPFGDERIVKTGFALLASSQAGDIEAFARLLSDLTPTCLLRLRTADDPVEAVSEYWNFVVGCLRNLSRTCAKLVQGSAQAAQAIVSLCAQIRAESLSAGTSGSWELTQLAFDIQGFEASADLLDSLAGLASDPWSLRTRWLTYCAENGVAARGFGHGVERDWFDQVGLETPELPSLIELVGRCRLDAPQLVVDSMRALAHDLMLRFVGEPTVPAALLVEGSDEVFDEVRILQVILGAEVLGGPPDLLERFIDRAVDLCLSRRTASSRIDLRLADGRWRDSIGELGGDPRSRFLIDLASVASGIGFTSKTPEILALAEAHATALRGSDLWWSSQIHKLLSDNAEEVLAITDADLRLKRFALLVEGSELPALPPWLDDQEVLRLMGLTAMRQLVDDGPSDLLEEQLGTVWVARSMTKHSSLDFRNFLQQCGIPWRDRRR